MPQHCAGRKNILFPWRNWCLWTTYWYSNPSFLHPIDFKISSPLASNSAYNTLGWLPLDCRPCHIYKCCFLILHRRGVLLSLSLKFSCFCSFLCYILSFLLQMQLFFLVSVLSYVNSRRHVLGTLIIFYNKLEGRNIESH